MRKKYILLRNDSKINEWDKSILYRIKSLVDIPQFNISIGDLGGYIQSEKNLDHYQDAWVAGDSEISCDAIIDGNAWVNNCKISDQCWIGGYSWVNNSTISGVIMITSYARVNNSHISGTACIGGKAIINNAILKSHEYITYNIEVERN